MEDILDRDSVANPFITACPACGEDKRTCANIGIDHQHWFFCETDKIKWCVGTNLFCVWQHDPFYEHQSEKNAYFLVDYSVVQEAPDAERDNLRARWLASPLGKGAIAALPFTRREMPWTQYLTWVAGRKAVAEMIDIETCEISCWPCHHADAYDSRRVEDHVHRYHPENDHWDNLNFVRSPISKG